MLVQATLDRTNALTTKTKTSLVKWKRRVQDETCASIPTECSGDKGENRRRSFKQTVWCRHLPSPCQDEEEDEFAQFVSPLDKKLVNDSTRLYKENTGHENDERIEQIDDDAVTGD